MLESKQRSDLRVGMHSAFKSYGVLRMYISDECDKELNDFTNETAGLRKNFDAILDEAEASGWLDHLLSKMTSHSNKTLAAVSSKIHSTLQKTRPLFFVHVKEDPFGALFLAREECFIGRQKLRERLRDLGNDQGNRRVLFVSGRDKLCGKSYTYDLLRLLDRISPNDYVVRIDLKNDLRAGALANRYNDIIDLINIRVGLSPNDMPQQNESATRWFEHSIRKFDAYLRQQGKRLWLVFDHISNNGMVEPTIADALSAAIGFVAGESVAIRVVLIDIRDVDLPLEPRVRNKLHSDNALLPDTDDIASFLKQAREVSNRHDVSDEDITFAAQEISTSLDAVPREERPFKYSRATWDTAIKLGFLEAD